MTPLLALACAASLAASKPPAPPPVQAVAPPAPVAPAGSLWSESRSRALLGYNGNARTVGDLITVVIDENTKSGIDADTSTSRDSSSEYGVKALLGLETSILKANPNMGKGTLDKGGKFGVGGYSSSKLEGAGATSRNGTLEATLTCTVQEVLDNGNLRVRGTKAVRVNRETQYLTLEGIVRSRDIRIDNTVQSNLLAEARVEYTGTGVLADKQGPGWMTRVGDAVWGF
jgi:flagellar L-ring protein precursor FlgH